ncbi:MAG: TetR family transcriptional regulator, partial [Acidimicrobiia bacterium]|nr:TetR family transcriptional regulator [Acidimicrobiia bacterium]
MATRTEPTGEHRAPLTRDKVYRAAVDLADRDEIQSLTMRNLASELGVEAMSLYYHVANKEAILDGVVDVIVAEINEALADDEARPVDDWASVLRSQILTARQVML